MEFAEIPSADESEDSEYENDNDFETSVRDVVKVKLMNQLIKLTTHQKMLHLMQILTSFNIKVTMISH